MYPGFLGAPAYFESHAPPEQRRHLADHVYINWRPDHESPPYRWEFTEDDRDFSVSVESRIVMTDAILNL